MAVTIMCPNLRCRKILMIPDSMRGSRVRCSYCGMILRVPKPQVTMAGFKKKSEK